MAIEIKKGDVLLYPNNKNNPIYKYTSGMFGEFITNLLVKASNYRYMHTAVYICPSKHKGYFWTLEAIDKGIYLIEKPISHLQFVDIIRRQGITEKQRKDLVDIALNKYWNKPYDFTSLLLNGVCQLAEVVELQDYLKDLFMKYADTPHMLICSELVARLMRDVGLPVEKNGADEFVTPSDLAESPSFAMILKNTEDII
ncbi:MAG TPA: hypothetical protein ENG48_11205 [Candidatus Atribacteria bacterium]|nr:hypothetical protein [Candidatus Atribacteria bacterium]